MIMNQVYFFIYLLFVLTEFMGFRPPFLLMNVISNSKSGMPIFHSKPLCCFIAPHKQIERQLRKDGKNEDKNNEDVCVLNKVKDCPRFHKID